jgi:hypothetical protein
MSKMAEAELCTASLDIDSCFVATEIIRYPDLKDVAAVVGGGGSKHQGRSLTAQDNMRNRKTILVVAPYQPDITW